MDIVASLKRAEIFLGLNDSDLRKIAELPSCREEAYQEGEVVFRADDEAKEIYVLTDGQIDLVTEVPQAEQENTRVVVDRITTGDFFGWSSLVDPHSRVMEAICQKPSRVVIISGAELMALFEEDNRIGYKTFQSLSSIIGTRLRYMEQALLKGKRWPLLEKHKGHTAT